MAGNQDILTPSAPVPRAVLQWRLVSLVRLLPADVSAEDLDALRALLAWPAFWRNLRERHDAFKREWKEVQEKLELTHEGKSNTDRR